MDNFETPWLTFTNAVIEPGYMGKEVELSALHRRTEALDVALSTGSHFDILLDMLAEDGQDPVDYVDNVGEKIELVIAQHIVPDDWNYWQVNFK